MRRAGIAFCVVVAVLAACAKRGFDKPIEKDAFLKDTLIRLTVHDAAVSADSVRAVLDRCVLELQSLEGMTTAHVDTSDISSINRKAGKEPAAVRPETFRLLEQSLALSKQMDGAFDVTLGAIKSLWGFDTENPSIPPDRAIRRLVRFTGSSQIVLGKGTAFLRSPDTRIDLGGLGEGYLIDRGVRMLRDAGITAGIVEATGDLVAFGRNPKRGMWRIGVKHPRDPEGGLIGVIETDEASVATSGDYERYFVTDGKRYCHILDPKTGYPADNGCISVTVLAPNALVADAFATGVFVMRPEMALALIERTPGLEGIIMTEENGQIRQMVSRGLQSKYKLL